MTIKLVLFRVSILLLTHVFFLYFFVMSLESFYCFILNDRFYFIFYGGAYVYSETFHLFLDAQI